MIDLPARPGHDPRPLTASAVARLVVTAMTAVAVQVSLVDPATAPVLRHLDLPLALASVLVLARPQHSTVVGLVFGLLVDASSQRLFGLHTVAYCLLGPVADTIPVPAWRRPGPLVAWRAGMQALVAATIVATGRAVAAGDVVPGTPSAVLQTAVLVGLVAIPGGRWLGVGLPLGRRP